MPRIPGVNHLEAVRALKKAGFSIARQSGHIVMTDGSRIVTIPRHNPVNAVTMGGIVRDAGLTVEEFRKEEYKMLSDMVPLKRMGTVEDIANLIFFLVTDQSEYLTGVDINITGGTLMH